jgi:hypothetical protein
LASLATPQVVYWVPEIFNATMFQKPQRESPFQATDSQMAFWGSNRVPQSTVFGKKPSAQQEKRSEVTPSESRA